MSIFDLGSLDDRLNLSESFNSPLDKNAQFMDDHGENLTKAFIIAMTAYALGGGGGEAFGGEANTFGGIGSLGGGEGGGGGSSSGGALSQWGGSALGNLQKLGGGLFGGGQQQQPQPQPFYTNPFSPQPSQDASWQPAHFQNNSFSPYMQNVSTQMRPRNTNMGMQGPQQMFAPRTGIF